MEDLLLQISRIRKKICKSSGCSYLYSYFDELVKALETKEAENLSGLETESLKELIEDYAMDSCYNTHSSANWVRYSARCFYCADRLSQYLDEKKHSDIEIYLNGYFHRLEQAGVAAVISEDILDKYILLNIQLTDSRTVYNTLMERSVRVCMRGRLWSVDEMSLELENILSIKRLILKYIEEYSDYSVLKEWLPKLETVRLAKIWYEFPDSANYRHMCQSSRERVDDILDKMLNAHLELFSFWYCHNPQEVIDSTSLNDLIEIIEVTDDDVFEKILNEAITLPWNEKVEGVLKHFVNDDEQLIVNLSRQK